MLRLGVFIEPNNVNQIRKPDLTPHSPEEEEEISAFSTWFEPTILEAWKEHVTLDSMDMYGRQTTSEEFSL